MGLATAQLLASRGATISMADLNEGALKSATSSLAPSLLRHIWTRVDVRDTKSVNAWIERTTSTLGKLDGAVNMAGVITPSRPITEETDENFAFTLSVNTQGVFACLRAELNAMQDGSSIVSKKFQPSVKPAERCRSNQGNPTFSRYQQPATSGTSDHREIQRTARVKQQS